MIQIKKSLKGLLKLIAGFIVSLKKVTDETFSFPAVSLQYTFQVFEFSTEVTEVKLVPAETAEELLAPESIEYQQLPGFASK